MSDFYDQGALIKRAALLDWGNGIDLNSTSIGQAVDKFILIYQSTSTIEPLASLSIGRASTRKFGTALSETNAFRPNHYGLLLGLTILCASWLIFRHIEGSYPYGEIHVSGHSLGTCGLGPWA